MKAGSTNTLPFAKCLQIVLHLQLLFSNIYRSHLWRQNMWSNITVYKPVRGPKLLCTRCQAGQCCRSATLATTTALTLKFSLVSHGSDYDTVHIPSVTMLAAHRKNNTSFEQITIPLRQSMQYIAFMSGTDVNSY